MEIFDKTVPRDLGRLEGRNEEWRKGVQSTGRMAKRRSDDL